MKWDTCFHSGNMMTDKEGGLSPQSRAFSTSRHCDRLQNVKHETDTNWSRIIYPSSGVTAETKHFLRVTWLWQLIMQEINQIKPEFKANCVLSSVYELQIFCKTIPPSRCINTSMHRMCHGRATTLIIIHFSEAFTKRQVSISRVHYWNNSMPTCTNITSVRKHVVKNDDFNSS